MSQTYQHISLNKQSRILFDIVLTIFCIFAYYLIAILVSFDPYDPSWLQISSNLNIHNIGGKTGAWLADTLLCICGIFAYLIPFIILFACYIGFIQRAYINLTTITYKIISIFILIITSCSIIALQIDELNYFYAGGVIGKIFSSTLLFWLDQSSATLLLLCFWFASITLFMGWYWIIVVDTIGGIILYILSTIYKSCFNLISKKSDINQVHNNDVNNNKNNNKTENTTLPIFNKDETNPVLPFTNLPPNTTPYSVNTIFKKKQNLKQINQSASSEITRLISDEIFVSQSSIQLPTIDLLISHKLKNQNTNRSYLEQTAKLVESCLASYRINVKVVGIYPGPVITRFELDLAPGVKVAQISNLSRDIARALSTNMVQIVEIIPGKPYVGLDIPNQQRQSISLRDVFDCHQFREVASPLSLVLGKDIRGQTVIVDLMDMPHLLIAGTTGSGKSVGINAMILSILYKATPKNVRLIMIDPKMLELSVYEGIPHLLTPVVTNMNNARNVLLWCLSEMERRYQLMSKLGVRNLTNYNRCIKQAQDGKYTNIFNKADLLPYIVIVVDELADLMIMLGKKIEELIVRLAQKARASGIHLVLATQRPSVDVITGLIKANIPTRIAFTVSSAIDSRTILDQTGAESLLGMGDMLYLASYSSLPIRVHGAFVQDEEVHTVVNYLKRQQKPQYLNDITLFKQE